MVSSVECVDDALSDLCRRVVSPPITALVQSRQRCQPRKSTTPMEESSSSDSDEAPVPKRPPCMKTCPPPPQSSTTASRPATPAARRSGASPSNRWNPLMTTCRRAPGRLLIIFEGEACVPNSVYFALAVPPHHPRRRKKKLS